MVLLRMVISFWGLHEYCRQKRAMGPFVTIAHVIAHCSVTVHCTNILCCILYVVPCALKQRVLIDFPVPVNMQYSFMFYYINFIFWNFSCKFE